MSDNIPELEETLQTSTQVESSDSRQELEPHVSTDPRYLRDCIVVLSSVFVIVLSCLI